MRRPQPRQGLGPTQDIPVFPPPGISPAVVRVLAARKARFVAVIDAGRPGHGHLPGRQELQPLLGRIFSRRHVGAAGCLENCQDPFDVVAADEVEHGVEVFRRVIFPEAGQFVIHAPRLFSSGDEVNHESPFGVVHGAVDVVAAKVFPLFAVTDFIRRIFPDFADEDGVGIFFFQGLIELPQKGTGSSSMTSRRQPRMPWLSQYLRTLSLLLMMKSM